MEEAARLNKRILPANCQPLEGVSPPPRLRELNYIYFYEEPKFPGSGFGTGLAGLIAALNTDFDWLRDHTRYLQRAIEWDTGERPANRLLSGDDIAEAKAWAARRPKGAPEPTALHLEFIRASEEEAQTRLSEQRKQLEAVAAAQAARETALHEAEEALKQAADAQRRRTRIRNIALVIVSGLAGVALMFGGIAYQQRKHAEQQRIAAEEQRQQADELLARGSNIIQKLEGVMDIETQKEAFALIQAGADHGDPYSMRNLGVFYENGRGVPQDYAKALEWYEKAAAKGNDAAMVNLGALYAYGTGVTPDYAKAREWYEKAAATGNAIAMGLLGGLYKGVDYAKAREWFEKGAAMGDASSKAELEQFAIREALEARRYVEALQLQEAFAAKVEEVETKRNGKPGVETAEVLSDLAFCSLLVREFPKALAASDRGHTLDPHNLEIETNRAHALMFMGREDEAKALYLAHKGEPLYQNQPLYNSKRWERGIAYDFAKLREAGLAHPMMADVEKELGISR